MVGGADVDGRWERDRNGTALDGSGRSICRHPRAQARRRPRVMMTPLYFHLRDWALWSATEGWASGSGSAASETASVPATPGLLRRRISPLGQAALQAGWRLAGASDARIVCASRHGEFGRTLSILRSVLAADVVSPADFTLSVHHALAGLLSIAQGNRRGHTAISAGSESFGFGLLEALSCLVERPEEPILLIYYDEALPAPFDGFDRFAGGALAMALLLTASAPGARFSLCADPRTLPGAASMRPDLGFLRVLLAGHDGAAIEGERMSWQWRRHAEAA